MAEPSASEPVEQGERAVAFVDLAGFTALTEAHGDEEAVGLVERFTAITRAALGDGDQFIKSIGDAVMLTSSTPEAALALVQQLFEGCYRESDFPLPRAGIHAGRVIARGDDVFGGTVNLAARVAAQAFGGQVLATAKVADAARTMNITTIDLGNFELRNIAEPVELFEVVVCPAAAGSMIDPVCRMQVQRDRAAGRLRNDNTDYWFCSLKCAAAFATTPSRYSRS